MKKYKEFINENRAYGENYASNNMDFKFFISLEDADEKRQQEAFDEFRKYVTLETHNIKSLLIRDNDTDWKRFSVDKNNYWVWYIQVYESWGNSAIPRDTIDFLKLRSDEMRGENNLIISLDNFLIIGLEGVETLYKIKKDANKFNL
jgi:sulfatase maturation enzyme AslB (radical SAM superfamily)